MKLPARVPDRSCKARERAGDTISANVAITEASDAANIASCCGNGIPIPAATANVLANRNHSHHLAVEAQVFPGRRPPKREAQIQSQDHQSQKVSVGGPSRNTRGM